MARRRGEIGNVGLTKDLCRVDERCFERELGLVGWESEAGRRLLKVTCLVLRGVLSPMVADSALGVAGCAGSVGFAGCVRSTATGANPLLGPGSKIRRTCPIWKRSTGCLSEEDSRVISFEGLCCAL